MSTLKTSIEFAGDFSYAFYESLLRSCQGRYAICPLREFTSVGPGSPRIYVRHDIDISLEAAVRMGEIEAALGVAATYMVIPTSSLYDLGSAHGKQHVGALQEMGHEVSMHFDTATSGISDPHDVSRLEAVIDEQCKALGRVLGAEVLSLSFHRPVGAFLRGPDRLSGRVNAYSASLMDRYFSDSSGRWRQGNPIASLEGPPWPAAQILTHPIYWGPTHQRPADRLERFYLDEVIHLPPLKREEFELRLGQTGVERAGLAQAKVSG